MIRVLLALPPVAVFAWFAGKDFRSHRDRPVSRVEHVLHLLLGPAELALVAGVLTGATLLTTAGALATLVLGGIDEYIYHRALPPAEVDLHAKAHLALFMILVADLVASTVSAHVHL